MRPFKCAQFCVDCAARVQTCGFMFLATQATLCKTVHMKNSQKCGYSNRISSRNSPLHTAFNPQVFLAEKMPSKQLLDRNLDSADSLEEEQPQFQDESGKNACAAIDEHAIEAVASNYFSYSLKSKTASKSVQAKKCGKGKNSKINIKDSKKAPRFSVEDLKEFLHEQTPRNIVDQRRRYEKLFPEWMQYLCEGWNLLFHGVGSKLQLLETFRRKCLEGEDMAHFVVRGYQEDADVKELLNRIAEDFRLNVEKRSYCSLAEKARHLCEILEKEDKNFAILIHNIDGTALRDEDSQTALSYLAETEQCRIVASVDHVNAALLWDEAKTRRFRWLYVDATTREKYATEMADGAESKIFASVSNFDDSENTRTYAGLKCILNSLSANGRKLFDILAKNGRRGTMFDELYRACRDEFVVANETAFRRLLKEFADHNLIGGKTAIDKLKPIRLVVDDDMLSAYLNGDEEEEQTNARTPGRRAGNATADEEDSSDSSESAEN